MNREETVALVERVWATWSVDLPTTLRKQTYDAWHRIIHDLDNNDCQAALDEIVIEDSPWPPRPGTIRRRVLSKNVQAPTAAEAWSQIVARADSISHGEDGGVLHPLVAKVASSMGVSASHLLHTNGDRDLFMRRYEEALKSAGGQ